MEFSHTTQMQLIFIYSIILGITIFIFFCSLFGTKKVLSFIISWLIPHAYDDEGYFKNFLIYIFSILIFLVLCTSMYFINLSTYLIGKTLIGNNDFISLQIIINLPTIILIILLIKIYFQNKKR